MIFPLCNQKPDRAPCICGHTFILCWRCTGLVFGALLAYILLLIMSPIGYYGMLFIIPVGIDGILQYHYGIMSNNVRRFITGLIGGLSVLSGDLHI
jgi:uncharacterized membrane protein